MILATASSTASFDVIASSEWTEPVQVFKNGINGQPGTDGYNQATIFLYQRKNTQPNKPSSAVTYNFTTGLLTTVPTGWSQTIPAVNGNPCWVTTAAAVSQNSTVSVASSKWADVTKFVQDGQNGAAGVNSAQIVLYQRATQAPSKPSNNTTYTFSDGTLSGTLGSWSQSIPSGENPVWAITASANSTATTDIISSSEWSSQVKILENGIDGTNGTNGLNQATIFLYKRSATEPSKPTSTATYTFTTGALSPLPSGWTKTIPTSDGTPCWVTTSSAISSASTASVSGWSDVSKLAEDGSSVTVTLYTVKYLEGTSGTEIPLGTWQDSVPSVAPGNFLWTQTIIHFSDGTATESYSVARSAVNGVSPTVSQTEVQYQQSSVGTTPPSGTWSSTPPTAEAGKYIWTRTTVTYSDNVTSVSYSVSKNGADGQDSTSYWLIVSDAAIVKTVSGVFSPTAITLTAKKQTGTAAAANYQGRLVIDTYNGSTWTNNRVNTDAATTTYSIPTGTTLVRCSLYPNGDTAHANLLDQQVVPIVIDGVDGDDAYTIILTNESHTFPGTATAAAADSPAAICRIIAYKGATQISCYAGDSASATSIATGVTGLSCAISGNNSQNVTLTFTATSTLTSGGVLQIPIVADGKNFTKVFTYSIAFKGANGISITGVTNYYLATSASSGVTTASSWGWTTGIQSIDSSKEYLWNYEVTLGSNNTTISRTSPVIIGHYGEGIDGRGVSNIQEWYQVSTSGTSAPATPTTAGTGYSSTPIETSNASPYLWNYEVIYYTTGEPTVTDARVIGTHGTPGLGATVSTTSNGAIITDGLGNSAVVSNGVSITNVTNHYLATSVSSGVTTATSGWTTTIQSMNSTKQYLWNYEDVMGSNNQKISSTTPIIIGRYGQDGGSGSPGKGITSIVEWYQISNSNTTAPATPTTAGTNYSSTPIATTEEKPYLWNYEVINYTTGDPTITAARVIGTQGPKGADGEDGKMIYGTSNTAASSSTKSITCQENISELYPGLTIMSAFQNANTSTSTIYLSVASTAKPIYFTGSNVSSTNQFLWGAGSSIQFTYNGTAWLPVGHPSVYYGNSTVSAATAAKTSTINQAVICKGTTVFVDMTNKNTANSPTLNISGTGGKSIYAKGSTLSSASVYNWTDGCTVPFTFDGANWKMGQPSESNQVVAAAALAQEAKNTADGKITVFYEPQAPTGMGTDNIGDLWIDTDDNSLHRYNGTSWISVDNVGIQNALNASTAAQWTADHKINTYAATTAPTSSTADPLGEGDIWIDTDDDNKLYRWNGSAWIDINTVIQIGGRNLHKDSANIGASWTVQNGTNSSGTITLTRTTTETRIYQMPANGYWTWQPNTQYVASIDAKANAAGAVLQFGCNGGGTVTYVDNNNKTLTTEWQRYYCVFTTGASTSTGSMSYVLTTNNSTIQLRKPKLEIGNKATDWTPAPEDTDAAIATAQSAAESAQATANAATASAAAAQASANSAIKTTVSCYYRREPNISTIPSKPTTSTVIGTASTVSGAWEYVMPEPKHGCSFFTCEEYTPVSGTKSYSDVRELTSGTYTSKWVSSTNNVFIDGGAIYANSITADQIKGNSLTLGLMTTATQAAIDNSLIQVGGRNLLLNSGNANEYFGLRSRNVSSLTYTKNVTVSEWGTSEAITVSGSGASDTIPFVFGGTDRVSPSSSITINGQAYTYSLYIRNNHATNNITVTGNSISGTTNVTLAPNDTRRVVITGIGDGSRGIQMNIVTATAGVEFNFTFWHPKMEYGNKVTDWSPAPEDVDASVNTALANSSEFIVGNGTTNGLWKGNISKSSITQGTQITFWTNTAGASIAPSNATVAANIQGGVPSTVTAGFNGTWLNLTLSDGTQTGWYPCFYSNTTRLTTHYAVNNAIRLTFKTNITATYTVTINDVSSSQTYTVSGWWADANYDSNTVGTYAGTVVAGANGIRPYGLAMKTAANAWSSLTTSASTGTGTGKTKYGSGFYLGNIIYNSSNSTYNSGSTSSTCYDALGFDLRYSTNCGTTLTKGSEVYLVGTINNNDNLFYLDNTWWTQTKPTTEDGKVYVYVGIAYSTYQVYLSANNPAYKYVGGEFQPLESTTASSYITYIDANNGIHVHSANSTASYVQINSSGMKVVKEGTQVAEFGETVQLGETAKSHQMLDYHSMQLIDKEGNTYFHVSDLRDDTGYATLTDTFTGDGTSTQFTLGISATSVVSATVDGVAAAINWTSGATVTFTTAPSNGSNIVITYQTNSTTAKAYTLGTRGTGNIGGLSLAQGYSTIASGFYSHAEGRATVSRGHYSHAEGWKSRAIKDNSHAEGYDTEANGWYASHAEGYQTKVTGRYGAHAEGKGTLASGDSSHASGEGTIADRPQQTVVGLYNKTSGESDGLFVVGNGTSDSARSNALKVTRNGEVCAAIGVHGPFIQAKSSSTSSTAGVNMTIVPLHSAAVNNNYKYDPNGIFTFTNDGGVMIGAAGTYRVTGSISITPGAATSFAGVYVTKTTSGGTVTTELSSLHYAGASRAMEIQCGPGLIYLNSSGYTLHLKSRSTGTAGTVSPNAAQTYMLIERVL